MPCTFVHPLAVIPLRRVCPAWVNFAALVFGSMSPDFAYYVRQFPMAQFSHTLPGTFIVCLPTGLLTLMIFYILRRSLCFMLPQPHRSALMPLTSDGPRFTLRVVLIAAISVLVGAWTHTIWDSFTHQGGWSVQHIPMLHTTSMHMGGATLPAFYILQQLSTFGSAFALMFIYVRWLSRQPKTSPPSADDSDRWRHFLIGCIALIALSVGAPSAYRMASSFEGFTALRVMVFRTGVYSAAVFFPLFALSSIILDVVRRRGRKDRRVTD